MFETFLGWLSINLIHFGLRLMPYPEVEVCIRRAIEEGLNRYEGMEE